MELARLVVRMKLVEAVATGRLRNDTDLTGYGDLLSIQEDRQVRVHVVGLIRIDFASQARHGRTCCTGSGSTIVPMLDSHHVVVIQIDDRRRQRGRRRGTTG